MKIYILRKFYFAQCDPSDVNDYDAEIVECFTSKQALVDYCRDRKIDLDIDFEWDTDWQQYAKDCWIANGYDYIKMELQNVLNLLSGTKVSGVSKTIEKKI